MQPLYHSNLYNEVSDWDNKEIEKLEEGVNIYGRNWIKISHIFLDQKKTAKECEIKYEEIITKLNEISIQISKNKWNINEEKKLVEGFVRYNHNWIYISKQFLKNKKNPQECSEKFNLINTIWNLHEEDLKKNDYWDHTSEQQLVKSIAKWNHNWEKISTEDFKFTKTALECQKKYIGLKASSLFELKAYIPVNVKWLYKDTKFLLDSYEKSLNLKATVKNNHAPKNNRNRLHALQRKHIGEWSQAEHEILAKLYTFHKNNEDRWDLISHGLNKDPIECQLFFIKNSINKESKWKQAEIDILLTAVEKNGPDWDGIAENLLSRTKKDCQSKFYDLLSEVKLWPETDQNRLKQLYLKNKENSNVWKILPQQLNITTRDCKLQWLKMGLGNVCSKKRKAEIEFTTRESKKARRKLKKWDENEIDELLALIEKHGKKWNDILKNLSYQRTAAACQIKFNKILKEEPFWTTAEQISLNESYIKNILSPTKWANIAIHLNKSERECKLQCLKLDLIESCKKE